MGNYSGSGETKGLKRNNSVRHSGRGERQMEQQGIQKIMDDEIESGTDTEHRTTDKDAMEKECLLNLKKRLSHHEHIIDGLVGIIESQKGIIHRLLQPDVTNDCANEASLPVDHHSKQMKDSADALKQMLKPFEPLEKALKDSFTDVFGAINKCLKQFGKYDLFACIPHENHIPEKHLDAVKDNETQKRNIKDKVKRPQQMVDKKDQQSSKLRQEIQLNRQINANAPLQLFYKQTGKTIEEIEKGIKTILFDKFGAIDFTNCQEASDIDDKKLLIIPYIVTSRIAADAENAIKGIPNPGNTTLLLIHNQEAHALPTQRSSLTLTDQKFKNLRGIFDLAFTTGSGFYHCNMNSRDIDSFCSSFRPTSQIETKL